MEAGGVCLQKRRRRRRKRSETPAEMVSKGWGGPSPPPGHGERPAGRDGMCCGAGGGAGGVNHGAGSRPTGREERAEPSRAEPGVTLRMSGTEKGGIAPFLQPASTAGLRAAPVRPPGRRRPRGFAARTAATGGGRARRGALRARVPPGASPVRGRHPPPPAPGHQIPKAPAGVRAFPSPKIKRRKRKATGRAAGEPLPGPA